MSDSLKRKLGCAGLIAAPLVFFGFFGAIQWNVNRYEKMAQEISEIANPGGRGEISGKRAYDVLDDFHLRKPSSGEEVVLKLRAYNGGISVTNARSEGNQIEEFGKIMYDDAINYLSRKRQK